MSQTRRLAAILAADVVGYSRLMGANEEGTLERLKALRRELLDPKIGEHKGRVVKTTGDGLLVEFACVVDAVRCAVAVPRMSQLVRGASGASVAAAGISDGENLDLRPVPTIRDDVVANDQPAGAGAESRHTRVRKF